MRTGSISRLWSTKSAALIIKWWMITRATCVKTTAMNNHVGKGTPFPDDFPTVVRMMNNLMQRSPAEGCRYLRLFVLGHEGLDDVLGAIA